MGTIGERIREERKAKGWSQEYLGELVGLAKTTVRDLELGESKSTTKLHKFADAFGVAITWLETGRGQKHVNPSGGDQHSPDSLVLSSHSTIPDPDILHEALKLLVDDELHAGEYGFRQMSLRLIELYRRVLTDGGALSPEHVEEFWAEVDRRAARGKRGDDEVTERRRDRRR